MRRPAAKLVGAKFCHEGCLVQAALFVALRLPLLVGNHDLTWKCALCCPQNRGNNGLEMSWARSVV